MDKRIVEVTVKGAMPTTNGCAVFLGNEEKAFVIYVDSFIGAAISRAVNDEKMERPQTHELTHSILVGLGAEIDRVVINDVEEATFFARIFISMSNELGRKIVEIDARPSDSIVLALLAEKKIFVAAKVFDAVDDMTEILERILKQDE